MKQLYSPDTKKKKKKKGLFWKFWIFSYLTVAVLWCKMHKLYIENLKDSKMKKNMPGKSAVRLKQNKLFYFGACEKECSSLAKILANNNKHTLKTN